MFVVNISRFTRTYSTLENAQKAGAVAIQRGKRWITVANTHSSGFKEMCKSYDTLCQQEKYADCLSLWNNFIANSGAFQSRFYEVKIEENVIDLPFPAIS